MKKQKIKALKEFKRLQTKSTMTNLKKVNTQFKMTLKKKKKESWMTFIDDINGDMESGDLWKRLKKSNRKDPHRRVNSLVEQDAWRILQERLIRRTDPLKILKQLIMKLQKIYQRLHHLTNLYYTIC